MQNQSNPVIWGAWGGILGGVIAAGAAAAGEPLGGSVFGYAAGAFFWAWVVANIKNWIAARPLR